MYCTQYYTPLYAFMVKVQSIADMHAMNTILPKQGLVISLF